MGKGVVSGSKIDEYVRCFGGADSFFKKIMSSFDFDFSIISVKDFEVEVSNKEGFLPGIKCYELYHGKQEKCEKCFIDDVVKKKDKVFGEKNGRENYLCPIFDGEKNVVSVIKYDLEKREVVKEMVVRDEESDDIFFRILQNSSDVVYRYDFVECRFRYVSESVFTLLGFSLGEFVKMSYEDFLGRIHPDDFGGIIEKEESSDKEFVYEREYRWKCKDGEYRWFLDKRTTIFDEKGNRISIVGDIKDISKDKLDKLERERLEAKIVRMRKKGSEVEQKLILTDREKVVLWGLCRWPLLNDEELSEKLKLKRSTLTAIKNRLRGKGWFSLIYIPNFRKLNCEVVGFFDVARIKSVKVRDFDFMKDLLGIVLRNVQDDKAFGVFVAKRFVDFKKFCEDFCHENKGVRFRESSFFYGLDSFELKDSSGLVDFVFGLGRKGEATFCGFGNDGVELNVNEKRVFHAMVQNPRLSSADIAKKIWISKPTVIKIRNKLLDDGIVYAYVVPDFRKLGFKFVAKFLYEFDAEVPKGIGKDDIDSRVLFRVVGSNRIVKFALFESEDEYLEEVDLIREVYRKSEVYLDFKSDLFPIQKRGKGNLDLEPFIRELLFE